MSAAEPPGDPPSHTPPDDPRLAATPGSQPPERDRPSKALRHQRILAQLEAAPTLRASDLSAALGVSGETIRRDLMELQKQGRIDRTFGGAARPLTTEPARSDRRQAMIAEREAIANAVSEIIQPGEVLMLGGGVTTLHIARVLAARNRDLTVITHDFAMAAALGANPSFRVL